MGLPIRATLVIPAWDEAESIGRVLAEVPDGTVEQVIVVVSGPSDPTAAVARASGAQVIVQQRRGYGAACWSGATTALDTGAQIIAFLDGDYADPPQELPRVLAPILVGEADLALGWRDLRHFPRALPLHARLGNQLVLSLLWIALGVRFRDLPSFKVIRADALRELDMREMTYGWTVEMLVKAVRARLRIAEVPVVYRERLAGQSKVAGNFKSSLGAATKLVGCALGYLTWRPDNARPAPAASGH